MLKNRIYLDFAAATPLDERVFVEMRPYLTEQFYNPSASYSAARDVRAAYEAARGRLASQIGAKLQDVTFTAGATESINLAIQGVLKTYPGAKVAYGATEHQAVRVVAEHYPHSVIAVDQHGVISEAAVRSAVDDTTAIVSVGMVNSEIGTKQPIRKLAAVLDDIRRDRKQRGVSLPLYFHTDASQAFGSMDTHVHRLGVDMMTLSAGKLYGPKQTGLLYVHRNVSLAPLVYGGGQERGLRSGTENVAGVIGFAKAVELAAQERRERTAQLESLKATFVKQISSQWPEVEPTIPTDKTTPHILHLTIPGIDAERLLFMLDEQGVMVATGAACAANKQTGSHVLKAIGRDEAAIQGSIRCSFGHIQTSDDITKAATIFDNCLKQLKQAG